PHDVRGDRRQGVGLQGRDSSEAETSARGRSGAAGRATTARPRANAASCRAGTGLTKERARMLMPKRVKYRKVHRGRRKGPATAGNTLAFGEYGLIAMEAAWIESRQIDAARRAMTHH